jgi:hypothetical protein
MSCWGKSQTEVQARRDLKVKAVNAFCEVARAVPLSASPGNVVLDAILHYNLLSEIGKVLQTDQAEEILTTAKGCSSAPREARGSFHYNQPTFHAFLKKSAEVDCLGSYMEVAWAWAVQIVNQNPNSFNSGHPAKAAIAQVNAAEAAKRRELGAV